MSESLMLRLREATSRAHEEIEREMDMERSVRDLPHYRQTLEAFLGYYEPVERLLMARGGHGAYDPSARLKTPTLRHDLAALGCRESEQDVLPRCEDLPDLSSLGAALGCAYVLEGASLGGRQISKWLEDSVVPPSARTFFFGYGAETGARWKEFGQAVEEYGSTHDDTESVIDGANSTFATLQKWMTLERGSA